VADGASRCGVEELVRAWAPRVLGAVARRYGDFAAAEDAVQEALLAAHLEWSASVLPANPGGWLYRVACRRMDDHRDSEAARKRRESTAASHEAVRDANDEEDQSEVSAHDDTLALLFMCCHPSLTAPSAIALTLRAVGGLTTAEIASAFFVPEATMAQRISRAKQTIASSGASFSLPNEGERQERLAAVLHVLYLMFNEGYTTSSGPELVRVELSSEATRLARILHRLQPEHAEAAGLLALMLLTDARRRARSGPSGELIPLHEQDRSLWDRAAIAEGSALLRATFDAGAVSSYQLQAAIAALHDEARASTRPIGRRSSRCTACSRASPTTRWCRSIAPLRRRWCTAREGARDARCTGAGGRLADSHRLEDRARASVRALGRSRGRAPSLPRRRAATTNMAERNYLLTKARGSPDPDRGATRSVSGFLVDHVEQRLAGVEAAHVLAKESHARSSVSSARAATCGVITTFGAAPQRVLGRQRLGIGDVEARAREAAGVERLDQRRGVDHFAARDVDQKLPGFIAVKAARSNMCSVSAVNGRRSRPRRTRPSSVASRRLAERVDVVRRRIVAAPQREHAHAEAVAAARDLGADAAEADHQQRALLQRDRSAVVSEPAGCHLPVSRAARWNGRSRGQREQTSRRRGRRSPARARARRLVSTMRSSFSSGIAT
jgi:RNA polymerase sigma factor (sigma-70 family)